MRRRQTGGPSGRVLIVRSTTIALVLAWLCVALPVASPAADNGVRLLKTIASKGPLYVDSDARILYQVEKGVGSPDTVHAIDLDSFKEKRSYEFALPQSNAVTALSGDHLSGRLAAVDDVHHKLFYVHRGDKANLEIITISATTGVAPSAFNLCSPEGTTSVCGPTAELGVEGISYWAPGNKLYVLYITPVQPPPFAIGQVGRIYVQQIDAATGNVDWNYSVQACASLAPDLNAMVPVGRSGNELYLVCIAGYGGPSGGGGAGTASVLKLTVASTGVTRAKAFAAPGLPQRAEFDAATRRVFLLLGNALLAVFDGNNEVYVGLLTTGNRPQMGFGHAMGRLYLCSQNGTDAVGQPIGGLLASDAATATPPPPGTEFPTIGCSQTIGYPIAADDATSRIFVPMENAKWGVVHDGQPRYTAPPPFDPDQGAEDIAEKAGVTQSAFGAQAGAYGTRVVWVGGPIGLMDNTTPGGNALQRGPETGIRFQPSSRDIRLANIPTSKLSVDGMEAVSIAMDRDARYDADYSTLREFHKDERANLKKQTCTSSATCLDTTQTPTWPFEYSHCFAFGGSTDKATDATEGSRATCDLKALSLQASAESEKPLDKQYRDLLHALDPFVRLGSASASTKVYRDVKRGVVAHSESVSRNIVLIGPGSASVFIAEADAVAESWAAGHRGKADTSYSRSFHGVRIVDASGHDAYTCDSQCIPTQVVDTMNQVLGPRMRVTLPAPEAAFLHGSVKGVYASVVQDDWQRLEEQTLYDKPSEDLTTAALEIQLNTNALANSGYVIQLAGVASASTYRIFRSGDGGGGGFGPPPVPIVKTIPPTFREIPPVPGTKPHTETTTIVEKVRTGLRWVFRFGGSRASVVAGWILLLAPLYVTVRRRAFMRGMVS